jgi:nicotinamide-nucleotide amidase
MKIEILCTGDEILSGKTVNTNYSFIAGRLVDCAFTPYWGTTVGDEQTSLIKAFHQAAERADVVIVNGGLGPTVDDLSQQVAAEAAGVKLELNENWLQRIRFWYTARGRVMPENNTKQAMLPAGSEFIDNPIGTACGFALDIKQARFFFTPGVPVEMRMMIDQQIIPRLEKIRGTSHVTLLKRFHTFGIGESRADQLLKGIASIIPDRSIKLGFQSHYPQLETKLAVQGKNQSEINRKLMPVATFIRERFGDFVIAEDDETLEGLIVKVLASTDATVSVMEMHTGGSMMARLLRAADNDQRIRRGLVSMDPQQLLISTDLGSDGNSNMPCGELAIQLVKALLTKTGSSHGLVVLIRMDLPEIQSEPGADVYIAVSDGNKQEMREARLPGSEHWVRLGATELSLDCLRRFLYHLPVYQQIDFEQH